MRLAGSRDLVVFGGGDGEGSTSPIAYLACCVYPGDALEGSHRESTRLGTYGVPVYPIDRPFPPPPGTGCGRDLPRAAKARGQPLSLLGLAWLVFGGGGDGRCCGRMPSLVEQGWAQWRARTTKNTRPGGEKDYVNRTTRPLRFPWETIFIQSSLLLCLSPNVTAHIKQLPAAALSVHPSRPPTTRPPSLTLLSPLPLPLPPPPPHPH